jgi:hypothetical protein
MRQHNVWCVCVRSVWRGMLDCSPAYLSTQNARTLQSNIPLHTERHAHCSPAYLSTQNALQPNIPLHTERTAVQHTSPHRTHCSTTYLSTQNALQSNIPLHTERTHAHTPNVMLLHHHIWRFTFLICFKSSDFKKNIRAPWRWSE